MDGISSLTTGGELRNDFLLLLTEQIKNQDPLSPANSNEFIGQLSQFTQLERMESLNGKMDKLVDLTQKQLDQGKPTGKATPADLTQSALLLGKQIDYLYQPTSADPKTPPLASLSKTGTVESVTLKNNSVYMIMNNGDQIQLKDVKSITTPSLTGTLSETTQLLAA